MSEAACIRLRSIASGVLCRRNGESVRDAELIELRESPSEPQLESTSRYTHSSNLVGGSLTLGVQLLVYGRNYALYTSYLRLRPLYAGRSIEKN